VTTASPAPRSPVASPQPVATPLLLATPPAPARARDAADGERAGASGASDGPPRRRLPIFVSAVLEPAAARASAAAGAPPRPVRLRLGVESAAARQRRTLLREIGPPPKLSFLETRSVTELSIGEVRTLLAEYQWLSRASSLLTSTSEPCGGGGKGSGDGRGADGGDEPRFSTPQRRVPSASPGRLGSRRAQLTP